MSLRELEQNLAAVVGLVSLALLVDSVVNSWKFSDELVGNVDCSVDGKAGDVVLWTGLMVTLVQALI